MTNKKIYKKIRRTGIWGTVVSVVAFAAIIILVLLAAGQQFIAYVIDTKLAAEYETFEKMADQYRRLETAGAEDVFGFLDMSEREYMILDGSGNVQHATGIDTRAGSDIKIDLGSSVTDVYAYADRDHSVIYPVERGRVALDPVAFVNWFNNGVFKAMDDVDPSDVPGWMQMSTNDTGRAARRENSFSAYSSDGKVIYLLADDGSVVGGALPIWVTVGLDDSGAKLVGKALFGVRLRDLEVMGIIAAVIGFVVMLLSFYLIIHALVEMGRQHRVTGYFFSDAVTGGNNRMYFQIKGEELLKKIRNRNKNYAIVDIELLNYRNYVVSHSLRQGEALLRKVYRILDNNTHNKNERCAHMTTPTFGLILRYLSRDGLEMRLNGLLGLLGQVDDNHKFAFQAGVKLIDRGENAESTDIASWKDVDIDEEYNKACTARTVLTETDETGFAIFDEQLIKDQQWLDPVQDRQAKAVENEEFVVYYQPKYNPKTDELCGAEALIRWQSPELGFVTPFRFIPIFEKNGFITEIDHYMISHVARDQKRWLDAGFKSVPVSVNVSRAHFIENTLAEQIRDIVDKAGCPHELIEIELTESAFFDDKKAMIETINKLKSYGFAVSMDDFGAGYSSLNSLKDMPLDVFKLDAEFFRGASEDGRGEIVVSEAIKLAKNLNMRVVAEGVELKEQVDFLAAEDCDMIQGYYYAKPMPGNDFEQRMGQGFAS